jgi:hypothetical protein
MSCSTKLGKMKKIYKYGNITLITRTGGNDEFYPCKGCYFDKGPDPPCLDIRGRSIIVKGRKYNRSFCGNLIFVKKPTKIKR